MAKLSDAHREQISNMRKAHKNDEEICQFFLDVYRIKLTSNEISNRSILKINKAKNNVVKTTTKKAKKSQNKYTYLARTGVAFWRVPILTPEEEYLLKADKKTLSKEDKRKKGKLLDAKEKLEETIDSVIPAEVSNRQSMLTATIEHVFTLVSVLSSDKIPINVKYKECADRLEELSKTLESLETQLEFFLSNPSHPLAINLRKKLNNIPQLFDGYSILKTLNDSACYLRFRCNELKKNPGKRGNANPAYYECINNLYDLWEKQTGDPPTIAHRTTDISIDNSGKYKKTNQKPYGDWYSYLCKSITSAISYANEKYDLKIPLPLHKVKKGSKRNKISLANIASRIIHFRLESQGRKSA